MDTKVIAILWLFALMVIFYTVNTASINDGCPLPSQLKSNYDFDWTSNSNEWSNPNAVTAFLQLVLSWSPTFCQSLSQSTRDKLFQCRSSNQFGIVVHGLWPQAAKASSVRAHPRNCRMEKQLNATFVKRFYCMMPDEVLIQAQWEKHGTCYYNTATDYFTKVEKLYKSLNIPNIASMQNPTKTSIKNEFLKLNPKLFSSAIDVKMNSDERLQEIKICFNLNDQLINCKS